MSLPYNNTIPATPNNPSNDQPLMLQNFASIASFVGVDHFPFADDSAGQHQQVTFPETRTDPTVATDQGMVYTGGSGAVNLKFANSSGNFNILGALSSSSLSANGYMSLTNGFVIQWGSASTSGNSTSVSFPLAFPNNAWSVVATGIAGSTQVNGITTSGFTASVSVAPLNIKWIAIGN